MGASDVGHAYVRIGDARESDKFVVSDAWPEFGRAVRAEDFKLGEGRLHVVREYDAHPNPDTRQQLLNAPKWAQSQVDQHFEANYKQYKGLRGEALAHELLYNSGLTFYKQVHSSKNLGMTYHDPSTSQTVDQSLSMRQFNERLVKAAYPPIEPAQPARAHPDLHMSDAQFANSMDDVDVDVDMDMDVDMYFNDDPYDDRW
ncbi:hypothetical protein ALQ64_04225 [Pseudomonas cannabina]|uniref:Uncharacterized protein n=2 Tax=Pseudomonas cannabina TaxID=86840 RepID=A0A0P9M3X1_PSECA|nr:Uncharacterized protein ALO81_01255 [Pseudomonas cannabina]RMN29932.1 hypothetical protein ALQ64_04225 [Pseudomonas cannabina]